MKSEKEKRREKKRNPIKDNIIFALAEVQAGVI